MNRNICFTLNNYTDAEEAHVKELECKYMVFGHEVGESGTPHLQGYIEFETPIRLTTLKNKIGRRAHLEARLKTAKQASDYCKKQDKDFFEKGTISNQGKRSDLQQVVEIVQAGGRMSEIAEQNPVALIKFGRGIKDYINQMTEHRKEAPKVYWFWGLAGVGKTKAAVEMGKSYIKDGTQWWDGYQQEQVIIIDDFDGHWPFRDLLRLLDRYPYQGQTKGGYVKINSPIIVITCEFAPEHFWKDNELNQVQRRLFETRELRVTDVTEVAGNTGTATFVTNFLKNEQKK